VSVLRNVVVSDRDWVGSFDSHPDSVSLTRRVKFLSFEDLDVLLKEFQAFPFFLKN
jgi:hypothetical protein